MFEFTINAYDSASQARTGTFATPHGTITTPCFMPCGTKGAVKTLTPDELRTLGCEIILGNTYHLMLRPGGDFLQEVGGLARWNAWNGPMLTDSGGFQVFSLSKIRKITDEGVTFQSHIDGSTHVLTPERSIHLQEQIGADIMMAFDECAPGDADYAHAKEAMERTHLWALRCMKAKRRSDQALFPIVQGGTHQDLRTASAEFMVGLDAPGIAIGGVAVGESDAQKWEVVNTVAPLLPKEKPHYLMGIGEPRDILEAVAHGIDMFDCVLPTRLARHGNFWTHEGRHSIENSKFTRDHAPLEPGCGCYTCQHFTRSYLRHLANEKEMLVPRLLTIHNLHFLLDLMRKIRVEISKGTFSLWQKNLRNNSPIFSLN